jgi:hypothetical protein
MKAKKKSAKKSTRYAIFFDIANSRRIRSADVPGIFSSSAAAQKALNSFIQLLGGNSAGRYVAKV